MFTLALNCWLDLLKEEDIKLNRLAAVILLPNILVQRSPESSENSVVNYDIYLMQLSVVRKIITRK